MSGLDATARNGEISRAEGRFPANLVLSHNDDCENECSPGCAVAMLDEQSGSCGAQGKDGKRYKKSYGQKSDALVWIDEAGHAPFNYGDSGGASRFFYCAKASKSDRNRRVNHGQQTPDRKVDESDELFDSSGNPSGRHGA